MSKKTRKVKPEDEGQNIANDCEVESVFPDRNMKEMKCMWEIPQVFHFLQLTREALNLPQLSLFEVERMLLIPRASKLLTNIMTSLLSSPFIKTKLKKLPPMPYEFWTNILAHKVKNWFKVYESKHRNPIKVLETIGVEPEFWNIFPSDSILDGKDFEDFSFRQRVWLLKTCCDTLMHTRKAIQEEMAKQPSENRFETVLGTDLQGWKYIYFPQFIRSDLRIYKHKLDDEILSNVKPVKTKPSANAESKTELENSPIKKKLRHRKRQHREYNCTKSNEAECDEAGQSSDCKSSTDSASCSLTNENTCFSSISSTSNTSNMDFNTINAKRSRSCSKTSIASNISSEIETKRRNTRSSGYDSNTSTESTSDNRYSQKMFKGFLPCSTDKCNIEIISGLLNDLNSEVVEDKVAGNISDLDSTVETLPRTWKTDDEKLNEIISAENAEINKEKLSRSDDEKLNESFQSPVESDKVTLQDLQDHPFNSDEESNDDNDISLIDLRSRLQKQGLRSSCNKKNKTEYNLRKQKKNEQTSDTESTFDCDTSKFQLVADSRDTLKELISNLSSEINGSVTKDNNKPSCGALLVEKLKELLLSVDDIQPVLRESAKKARNRLQQEWAKLQSSIMEDQDPSAEGGPGSNWWLIGSQGCALPSSTGATTIQAVQESTVSQFSTENLLKEVESCQKDPLSTEEAEHRRHNSTESPTHGTIKSGETDANEACTETTNTSTENREQAEEEEEEEEEQQTRRVLRARGISSYIEQFSSDDDFEKNELETWPNTETVNSASGTQTYTSTPHITPKIRHNNELSSEEDSDQDWILPGSRKRRNRRPSANRRLKSFQQKIESIKFDIAKESNSSLNCNDPAVSASREENTKMKESKIYRQKSNDPDTSIVTSVTSSEDTNQPDKLPTSSENFNCKVEYITSIHSELDIKDEGPICDSTTNQYETNYGACIPQSYVMLNPNHATMNYYVMQPGTVATSVIPQGTIVQAPFMPTIVPPVEQAFYVQEAPSYIIPNTQQTLPSQQQPELQMQDPGLIESQQHMPHPGYLPYVVTTTHAQGQPYAQNSTPQTVPPPSQIFTDPFEAMHLPRLRGSLPQGQQFLPRGSFPHPSGAVIRSTIPIRGGSLRGASSRPIRANRPRRQHPVQPQKQWGLGQQNASTASTKPKTTSLIVLSDSDDEIEMIITEKADAGSTENNNQSTPQKHVTSERRKPTITSNVAVSVEHAGLSPQIVHRMNQGGISITPVKPPSFQNRNLNTSSNPPLVVVVNDTGSHYALALPDGNKLILTPAQVAQIRAYNGGKLVV